MNNPNIVFLAANAPQEIPSWFKHWEAPDKPVLPDIYEMVPEQHRDDLRRYLFDPCFEPIPEIKPALKANAEYQSAMSVWREADQQTRYFQWRKFYAERLNAILD